MPAGRYVRQEHPLWQELHAGVLTTGKLQGALGMQEDYAARIVGSYRVSVLVTPLVCKGWCSCFVLHAQSLMFGLHPSTMQYLEFTGLCTVF